MLLTPDGELLHTLRVQVQRAAGSPQEGDWRIQQAAVRAQQALGGMTAGRPSLEEQQRRTLEAKAEAEQRESAERRQQVVSYRQMLAEQQQAERGAMVAQAMPPRNRQLSAAEQFELA